MLSQTVGGWEQLATAERLIIRKDRDSSESIGGLIDNCINMGIYNQKILLDLLNNRLMWKNQTQNQTAKMGRQRN